MVKNIAVTINHFLDFRTWNTIEKIHVFKEVDIRFITYYLFHVVIGVYQAFLDFTNIFKLIHGKEGQRQCIRIVNVVYFRFEVQCL